MHDFGENDTAFASVESLLTNILSSKRQALNISSQDFANYKESMRFCITKYLLSILTSIECLQSLFFKEMNEREYDVINASKNTCTWLAENPVYIQWFEQQHGLLWIKGYPGVGKSTIMKYILKSTSTIEDKDKIIMSFFFHDRGTLCQKSLLGLYRSLLHRLAQKSFAVLRKITDIFRTKCKTQGEHGERWEWHQNELQELFISQVQETTKTCSVRIYIDALDECGEEAVHLIDIFQKNVATVSSICFSCRHYPQIALENGSDINVETNNANDIRTYVNNQLGEQKSLAEVRGRIIEKASGNFQWVKIVANLVISWRREGLSLKSIQKKIASIPEELNQLYKELLSGIDESEKPESLYLMRWICYALRPLSVTELRFAIIVDTDNTCLSISECEELERFVTNDEDMEKRICHLSAGLAEVIWHSDKSTVQLIHQSASDFFRGNLGFQLLNPSEYWTPASSPYGHAQLQLSSSCIKYLSMREVVDFVDSIEVPLPPAGYSSIMREIAEEFDFFPIDPQYLLRIWLVQRFGAKNSLEDKFGFFKYAICHWLRHVEILGIVKKLKYKKTV